MARLDNFTQNPDIFHLPDAKHASDSINGPTERKSAEVIPYPLSKLF
jgi:hypothetical protein